MVWLVGAGPGDPELLTLKALRLLQSADVVVHDRLTPRPILDLARPGARMIDVGKRKSRHTLPQDGINALLVGLAREGLTVVRLKGGDPFLFGRGGEELEFCRAAGVEAHVVPGVTAALAAAADAGAPLTHRGLAQAVTFVTGHAASGGEPDLDWASLARPNHTVAVYMGLSTASGIAARLIAAGRPGSTPVAVVENASLVDERRLLTTLAGPGRGRARPGRPGAAGGRRSGGAGRRASARNRNRRCARRSRPRGSAAMNALTANRLVDGEVVFWSHGRWVEHFGEAELFTDDALGEAAEAKAKSQPTVVVEPYLIEIARTEDGYAPVAYRERLRALGPTNTPQHGKQAEGGHDVEVIARASGAARSGGRVNLIKRK